MALLVLVRICRPSSPSSAPSRKRRRTAQALTLHLTEEVLDQKIMLGEAPDLKEVK